MTALTLKPYFHAEALAAPPVAMGTLTRLVGLTLEALGLNVSVGSHCQVLLPKGRLLDAEVVGFAEDKTYLMPVQKWKACSRV